MIPIWIINDNDATQRIYRVWMDDIVDDPVDDLPGDGKGVAFDGPTQVVAEVGERLTDQVRSIHEHTPDDEDGADDAGDDAEGADADDTLL